MFKFNFDLNDSSSPANNDNNQSNNFEDKSFDDNEQSSESTPFGIYLYKDLISSDQKNLYFKKFYLKYTVSQEEVDQENQEECESDFGQAYIEYVDSSKVELSEDDILAKINKTHDLVPRKYEGGLKIWELSVDLSRFIYNIQSFRLESLKYLEETSLNELKSVKSFLNSFLDEDTKELRLLELGCGHALPSLSVLKLIEDKLDEKFREKFSIVVYLQDFNEKIIKDITFENVKKYLERSKLNIEFKFVYGDWRDIFKSGQLLPSNYFNLILTSETIYNAANYKHLLNLFQVCLRNQKSQVVDKEIEKEDNYEKLNAKKLKINDLDSIVLLSAKTYYFGCGGNLHEFLLTAKSSTYQFKSSKNLLFESIINSCYCDYDHDKEADNDDNNGQIENKEETQDESATCKSSIENNKNNNNNSSSTSCSTISKEIIKIYY